MRYLVLDPRRNAVRSTLFEVQASAVASETTVGYAPEVHYDAAADEVLVLDTEFDDPCAAPVGQRLKRFHGRTLELIAEREIPERLMYAGFAGRSATIASCASGRYAYFVTVTGVVNESEGDVAFRLAPMRYDRRNDVIEAGAPSVVSCLLDFGVWNEDDIYLHLMCDYPSTVARGQFRSPDLEFVSLEQLTPRNHSERETCASWFDRANRTLYCVTRGGAIHSIKNTASNCRLGHLPLEHEQSVPLEHLQGGGGYLFVGVANDDNERSVSLASQVWRMSLENPADIQVFGLPIPVINFVVSPDGRRLIGSNPYLRTVFAVDLATGTVETWIEQLGMSPAEIILLP